MSETAAGLQAGGRDYPRHWGLPEGRTYSNERAAWVARNIAQDSATEDRGYDAAEARGGKLVPRTGKRITRPTQPAQLSGQAALERVRKRSGR